MKKISRIDEGVLGKVSLVGVSFSRKSSVGRQRPITLYYLCLATCSSVEKLDPSTDGLARPNDEKRCPESVQMLFRNSRRARR